MSATTWLLWGHLLATVVLVGYYIVLAAIVIPAALRGGASGAIVSPPRLLADLERRALPLLLLSLAIFLATGVALLTGDPRYRGAGEVQGAWASLLLVKHAVVVGMLVVGAVLDGLLVGPRRDNPSVAGRVVWAASAQAVLGAVVLLITAAAQAA